MSDRRNARPEPAPGEATGGDWFYDELMTAQPDAAREFYRARLEAAALELMPIKTDVGVSAPAPRRTPFPAG